MSTRAEHYHFSSICNQGFAHIRRFFSSVKSLGMTNIIMRKPPTYLCSVLRKSTPKSPQSLASPDFPFTLSKLLRVRPRALTLVQELDLYISSEKYSTKFKSDLIMFQYSSFCLHQWMLKHRLQQEPWYSVKALLLRRSLMKLSQQFTKNHVFLYDDMFNLQVYYQLQRLKQTIFWSLDDYYKYGFRQKPLEQIINEDICIEENQEIEQELKQYIPKHIQYLRGLSLQQIVNEHIDWGLQS